MSVEGLLRLGTLGGVYAFTPENTTHQAYWGNFAVFTLTVYFEEMGHITNLGNHRACFRSYDPCSSNIVAKVSIISRLTVVIFVSRFAEFKRSWFQLVQSGSWLGIIVSLALNCRYFPMSGSFINQTQSIQRLPLYIAFKDPNIDSEMSQGNSTQYFYICTSAPKWIDR
jgi:hypothetical protein